MTESDVLAMNIPNTKTKTIKLRPNFFILSSLLNVNKSPFLFSVGKQVPTNQGIFYFAFIAM
jgi:hypothetical protein